MSLKNGKAPGPDGIQAEVIKHITKEKTEAVTRVINRLLETGVFPAVWKVARLVLIEKHRGTGKVKYRPICLLNSMAKLTEKVVARRTQRQFEPSEYQCGFKKGSSTVEAIEKIVEFASVANMGTHRTREICVLVTIDIRNAFSTVHWEIMEALTGRGITGGLRKLIGSYLSSRILILGDGTSREKFRVTCGVQQGSVLGPLCGICHLMIFSAWSRRLV